MLFKYFLKSPDFLKCKEPCIDLPNRLALLLRCLQFQGHIYWGGAGEPSPTPIIFLIFVLQNVTKLFLHFTFAAISICPGNKSWSIYELPPDCILLFSLVFTLVLNWKIIIMLLRTYSVISVIIVLSKKQTGSYSKIYRNCFYVACKDRTLSNPWVKSFSCIKMTSRRTS